MDFLEMAVGDIVNGIQAGGDFTFQPAGSNVICITSFGSCSNSSQLANGTIVAYMKQSLSVWIRYFLNLDN